MAATSTPYPGGGLGAALWGSMRQPGFVICTLTLAVLTATFYTVTWKTQTRLRKERADLRLPLGQLDRTALDPPYRLERTHTIEQDVLDTLGTDQYIQWVLEDRDADESSPVKAANLFVTYYTGHPDPVPHVPDACYLGAGFSSPAPAYDVDIDVPALRRKIPVRVLELEKKSRIGGSQQLFVAYFFGVNGQFASDRNRVRAIVANPWERYAYFSKVEVRFSGKGLSVAAPTRDETVEAAKKLFAKLVPILVEKHWPDWKALHDKPATTRP